jgi:catechol 2,3-dioxygenase-like lactoylglutathione lyase family enzyme
MEHHKGRLLDHVHLRVRDLEASRRFYRAVTESLGIPFVSESESHFAVDELFVSDDGGARLSLAVSDETLDAGLERLTEALPR